MQTLPYERTIFKQNDNKEPSKQNRFLAPKNTPIAVDPEKMNMGI